MKVLVIRYSSIGDVVLTSPVIRCLHQQRSAEVHLLTKKSMLQLVSDNPYIAKVYTIALDNTEVLGALMAEDYDAVVDLHKNIRSRQVVKAIDAEHYTFQKENINKWLLVNFKWDRLPDKHLVDRYFDGLESLGVENDGKGLDHFLAEADDQYGSAFAKRNERYVALVLGANYYTKRPPVEVWHQVIKDHPQYKYVLLGGKDVMDAGRQLQNYESVDDQTGRLTLGQSAAIIQRAAQVVSGDTGLMHIAAAYRVPLTSVWGSTVPKLGMYPYYGDHAAQHQYAEVSALSCRPCSKLGHKTCPKKHFRCMRDQQVRLFDI